MNKYSFLGRSGLGSVGGGQAQLRQAIQRSAAHQHLRRLPSETAGRDPVAKDPFEPKHGRLGQTAPMIVTLPFPGSAPNLANPAQILIPSQTLGLGVAVLPNLGIVLRWDSGAGVPCPNSLVTIAPVIAPIARHLSDLLLHLPQQV